jgi:serine/threonine protein kinase
MVMELVTGRTLREVLSSGPLPLPELLSLASQIADGLAKAHEAGIVHRDLKPDNLMITYDGLVKILDFGLAKLTLKTRVDSEMATQERFATDSGVIVGTAAYMSPEQAQGGELDFRSDQFSLGSILYEAASGRLAFKKGSFPHTLVAIMEAEPEPLARLKPALPARFIAVVDRLLAKDPAKRYNSTVDLPVDLDELGESPRRALALEPSRDETKVVPNRRRRALPSVHRSPETRLETAGRRVARDTGDSGGGADPRHRPRARESHPAIPSLVVDRE